MPPIGRSQPFFQGPDVEAHASDDLIPQSADRIESNSPLACVGRLQVDGHRHTSPDGVYDGLADRPNLVDGKADNVKSFLCPVNELEQRLISAT